MIVLSTLAEEGRKRDFALAVLVDGIPYAFAERGAESTVSGRAALRVLVKVQEGETRLDLEERRQVDATLDLELLDTDDADLRALFATNSRPATWVAADASAAATSIVTDEAGALTSPVYIGAETITFTGVSGETLTGCTRGAHNSTASAIKGTADDGESVYSAPPSWVGRRAQLVAVTRDAAGAAEVRTLSTWLVDEPPQYVGDGAWRLRLGGLANEYASRPVMMGVQAATAPLAGSSDTASIGAGNASYVIDVEGVERLRVSSSGRTWSHVAVTSSGADGEPITSVHELIDVDTATDEVEWDITPLFGTSFGGPFVTEIRPMGCLGGPSPVALLTWLLSDEGQGANAYDKLPGRKGSTYDGASWRVGAGFTTDEVDVPGILAVTLAPHFFALLSERLVGDLLREVCLLSRCTTKVTRLGKLTIVPLAERATSSVTFDGDIIDPKTAPTVELDEGNVSPLVSVSAGYDPITEEHAVTVNLVDVELARRYPRAPRKRDLELIGVHIADPSVRRLLSGFSDFVSPATTTTADLITSTVRDLQRGQDGAPARYVTLATDFAAWSVEVGDVVEIGSDLPAAFADLPDFEGGTIAGRSARVVGRRPDYDRGVITWRLLILEPVIVVCPTARIASRSGANVTLATTDDYASGSAPARDFWVGAQVRVYDRSTIPSGSPVSELRTVDAIVSDTVVTLSSAPSFAHGAGDYLVLSPSTSADGTSASGYSLSEMAMMVDADGTGTVSDPAATESPRWS